MLLKFRSKKKQIERALRYPAFGSAKLRDESGWRADVFIKEVSRTGARLLVENPKSVPNRIIIEIPAYGITTEAFVQWRSRSAIGIKFCAAVILPDLQSSRLDEVRR
jgi:hypothetical protein